MAAKAKPSSGDVTIRALKGPDRRPIEAMLRSTGFFSEEEVVIALELCDEATSKPDQQDYFFGVAELGGEAVGYVCYGQRPLSEGTYDLYWICTHARKQGLGIGKKLMKWAETEMENVGCRLVIVETSGRSQYEPTRGFYLAIGYIEEARIKDFYKPGDDLVIYTKRL